MPPLPRLRVSVLADLAEQLKFVPRDAARRQLENAEALLHDLKPDQTYPEDWLVHRLTGYRPELREPAVLVGAALLADLGALVERLSAQAEIQTGELPGWLSITDLCARWGVSRRTLERYRPLGLVGRRARNPRRPAGDGKQVLRFSPLVVDRFERSHRERLADARGFSRIDPALERRIVRRAARYRRRFNCSRGAAAGRLALRFGRSPDAIRRLLLRHDELHAHERPPTFPEPGPATDRQSRLIERASRWCGAGVEPALIAARLAKTPASIHRIALEQRAAMIRELDLRGPSDASFRAPASARAILAPDAVRDRLGRPPAASVSEFIAQTLAAGWPDPRAERQTAIAMWFLRWRAGQAAASLPPTGASAPEIDAIVTDLRWAARLKAELVRAEGMLLLKAIEGRVGRPLAELPPWPAARLLALALDALAAPGGAIDRYDPFKGGRVAAPAGLALNRVISRWTADEGAVWIAGAPAAREESAAGRATRLTPRVAPPPPPSPDWTRLTCPWQAWTEPDARIQGLLDHADAPTRLLLMRRYGWMISPPTTIVALAGELDLRPEQVTRRERQACRDLLVIARSLAAPTPARQQSPR